MIAKDKMDLRIRGTLHRKPRKPWFLHVFATSGVFQWMIPSMSPDGLKCCHRRVTMAQYRGVVKPQSQGLQSLSEMPQNSMVD